MALPFDDDDALAYESELARNPYAVRTWYAYARSKAGPGDAVGRNVLWERAVAALPGSFKLWHAYLRDRVAQVAGAPAGGAAREAVNDAFERGLVFMHKMPAIWAEYCAFLAVQPCITRTRRTFDRALQSLPVTQHERIWALYLPWVRGTGVWETCVRVYRRYLQYEPAGREEYVDYLLAIGHWDEAAHQLATIVNDGGSSGSGSGGGGAGARHAQWMKLCDVVSQHPGAVTSVRVEPVLRAGIRRFTDEVGRLWCALAEYFIRSGAFEKARDVFEEACGAVSTVRDFATVFDAYAQFEEAMLTAKLELGGADAAAAPAPAASSESSAAGSAAGVLASAADLDDLAELSPAADNLELRMVRLEMLMDKRPLLLSAVLLRQNPHNVHEWRKRCRLLADAKAAPARIAAAYEEAVRVVAPKQAVGQVHDLWVDYAKYYEAAGQMEAARGVFRRATAAAFKSVEDLAAVWCEWAEAEVRAKNYDGALRIMEEATREYRGGGGGGGGGRSREGADGGVAVPAGTPDADALRWKLHRNLRVWSMYLDLEEALGSVETVKGAYDRAMMLRVVTPAMVLNYARYLEERAYFEDAFRAFERGIAAFPWPHVKELWIAYLTKFVARYGGAKVERCRELFERAVEGVPPSEAATLYGLYADMEETHGLVRHAMAVYDRATAAVDDAHRYAAFVTYITKAEAAYGAPKTRAIYERAIGVLPDVQVKDMCLRFAAMETTLGEVDRARAIYAHAAQFCDPRTATAFWDTWQGFEAAHGNEDTFRDMLRIKRSVAAQFASVATMVTDLIASRAAAAASSAAAASAGPLLMAATDAPPRPAGAMRPSDAALAAAAAAAAAPDDAVAAARPPRY